MKRVGAVADEDDTEGQSHSRRVSDDEDDTEGQRFTAR